MEKMSFESKNILPANISALAQLFPSCITESRGEDGKLKQSVDFDKLRILLGGDIAQGDESYDFTWVGKNAAMQEAGIPIRKTLRPCKEESKNWDVTQNLYIEGDNLDVLKLLQESYLKKVKMIYIDPPYNTGHDFIYNDRFEMDKDEYNEETGSIDDSGIVNFQQNNDANPRFHSDWCSMIYPRLVLARNLLTDDGVIFISIDDHEQENLKKICDEIFGVKNILTQFCWKTDGNFDNQAKIKICHQYILLYALNVAKFPVPPIVDPNISVGSKLYNEKIQNTIVKNGPKNPISGITIPVGFPCAIQNGIILKGKSEWPKYNIDIEVQDNKTTKEVTAKSGWSSKILVQQFIDNNFQPIIDNKGQETVFEISNTGAIEVIKKRSSVQSHVISVLQNFGGSQKASAELEGLGDFFDYPKPVNLIKYFICMNYNNSDDIILDFFSGSATTAHAVMQLNAEDGGNRKFIMVQLPEKCDEKSEAYKAGYKTICDIGKERIRRAGDKINAELRTRNAESKKKNNSQLSLDTSATDDSELSSKHSELDTGFRVFKVDDSNMKDVYYSAEEINQQMLSGLESNIKEDRTDMDLLYGCLLDWGLPLSLPHTSETLDGVTVHTVDNGALIACFDTDIPESAIRTIAQRKPLRAVFRDSSFATSPEKINVTEIFKTLSPGTGVKVV